MALKQRLPSSMAVLAQQDSSRIVFIIIVMLGSALSGVVGLAVPWLGAVALLCIGVAAVLMSDQYARKNHSSGQLEGLQRHSNEVDSLRDEYESVLHLQRQTIEELKQRINGV